MVCGYTEPEHEVVDDVTVPHPTREGEFQRFVRCRPLADPGMAQYVEQRRKQRALLGLPDDVIDQKEHIRLELLDKDKKLRGRYILQFSDGFSQPTAPDAVEKTWHLLVTEPLVKFEDLPYSSLVYPNDSARTKDGGHIFY